LRVLITGVILKTHISLLEGYGHAQS